MWQKLQEDRCRLQSEGGADAMQIVLLQDCLLDTADAGFAS